MRNKSVSLGEEVDDGKCLIGFDDRKDCGWPGIKDWECQSRGCCFDPSVRNTTWCFYPAGGKTLIPLKSLDLYWGSQIR